VGSAARAHDRRILVDRELLRRPAGPRAISQVDSGRRASRHDMPPIAMTLCGTSLLRMATIPPMSHSTSHPPVDLSLTTRGDYHPGRSFAVRSLWFLVEAVVFLNPVVTSYRVKRSLLTLFGSTVGPGLIIKPGVHIKYPWRLTLGSNVWLGERAWLDNMEDIVIGDSVCISQGAYLCTGNHDWSDPGMRLAPRPIAVESGAWIGAFGRVGPGIRVGCEAVLTLGSTLQADAEPRGIYSGTPASRVGTRRLRASSQPS